MVADRQLEVLAALHVGRRVATTVPAAVDLHAQVDVLPRLHGVPVGERGVRCEGEGDAARRGAAHVDDLGAGLAQHPGGRDLLGEAIDAMRSGEEVYQV